MNIPVNDDAMDLVTIHHVLHFLSDPAGAVKEAARTLRRDGLALLVDFAPHSIESLRDEHAHRRLGFANQEVVDWCLDAGLRDVRMQRFEHAAHLGEQSLSVCLWSAHKRGAA